MTHVHRDVVIDRCGPQNLDMNAPVTDLFE